MPVISAIAGAVKAVSAWTITVGALGEFAIGNFLVRSAVQLGLSALMVKAMGQGGNAFSIQSQVRSGGIVPRSFVLGRTGTAGSLTWHSEWGRAGKTPNAYYTRVIALSDLPIQGLAEVFIDGNPVTLGAATDEFGQPAIEYQVDGTDYLWVKFYDGSQTLADPFLVNTVGPQAALPYESTRVGRGVAYAVVTCRLNQDLFTALPEAFFVLDGVALYDPSRDTSVGGDGAQRWSNPETWGGDGDHLPAVQAYNINRGIYFEGKWFYGLQSVSEVRLPAVKWIPQIEKCRLGVVTADGGTEPQFRCGGEVLVETEIGRTQENILASCSGRMTEVGGVFGIHVGAPDASVVTISDDDILSTASRSLSPFHGLSETINGVIATYPSPEEAYTARQAPAVYRADLEAEDGGRRLPGRVTLSMVPYPEQVQRLVHAEIRAARRDVRHSFTLPARFGGLEPSDTITFVSERNGYASKKFRIDGVIDLPNCDIVLDMTEVDPDDHATWDPQIDFAPPIVVPATATAVSPQPISNWSVIAAAAPDNDSAGRVPAIKVIWDPDVDDVEAIQVNVRVKGTNVVVFSGRLEDFSAGNALILSGLVPNVVYEVQVRYVPGSARPTLWSDWQEVRTLDLRSSLTDLADTVVNALEAAQADASAALAGHLQVESLAAVASALGQVVVTEVLRLGDRAGLLYGRPGRDQYEEPGFFIGSAEQQSGLEDFEVSHTHLDEFSRLSGLVHNGAGGFRIYNPRMLSRVPSADPVVSASKYTTSGTQNLGKPGNDMTLILVGGGGAGGRGVNDGGTGGTFAASGGDTVVSVFAGDPASGGQRIVGPIQATGGAGGENTVIGKSGGYRGTNGGGTSFGAGGAGGDPDMENGQDPEVGAFGAAGGGQGGDRPSTFDSSGRAGRGGRAGSEVTIQVDLRPYPESNIYIVMTVGDGGQGSGGGSGRGGVVAVANALGGYTEVDGHHVVRAGLLAKARYTQSDLVFSYGGAALGPFPENRLFLCSDILFSNSTSDLYLVNSGSAQRRVMIGKQGQISSHSVNGDYDALLGVTTGSGFLLDGSFGPKTGGNCWIYLEAGTSVHVHQNGAYATLPEYCEIVGISEADARVLISEYRDW